MKPEHTEVERGSFSSISVYKNAQGRWQFSVWGKGFGQVSGAASEQEAWDAARAALNGLRQTDGS